MKANEKIILTVFVFAVTAGAIVILYLFQLNETVRASISAVFICVVVAFAMLFYKLLKEGRRAEKIHNKHVYFLQTLIDTLPHPVFYKDDKGRYLGCNAAFEIFLGIRKEQLIGKTVFEIATPELAELYHKADLVLFNDSSSGAQIYQGPLNYADGTTHEVVFYKALFKNEDGSTGGLVGSILDITGQKKIEAAYKEQKEFSESLLQNSAVPTFVIDPNHIVLFWNRACEELTGIKAFNVIGTNGHWQAFYNHKLNCLADYIIDGKSIDSLVATQSTYAVLRKSPLHKDGVEAEGWFRNLNGKDRYLFFHAAPIRSID